MLVTVSKESWQTLTLRDMVYAYRKAKADCFFDHIVGSSRMFAHFELDIAANLSVLLSRLKQGEAEAVFSEGLGRPRVVGKKLSISNRQRLKADCGNGSEEDEAHVFFSDASRAFQDLKLGKSLVPEFRLVGDFSVEFHILSALWINKIGHRFDAVLNESAFGTRLKRHGKRRDTCNEDVGQYHMQAVTSFERYFAPYQRWRSNGVAAMRRELKAEVPVIAVALDFTSFYHRVDPGFILDDDFLSRVGIQLSSWEREFTRALVDALRGWSTLCAEYFDENDTSGERHYGLPIGLSAARIIANVVLIEFDEKVSQGLAPIYYGRYVDDVLLVLNDPGHITNGTELFEYLIERVGLERPSDLSEDRGKLTFKISYSPDTQIELQPTKQKAFFLKGQAGIDLLDTIEAEINSISSERRLMPLPDEMDSAASARVLTAAELGNDEAVTIGRADGLTVRRLGWSLQLRAAETLAEALNTGDWQDQRHKFYKFARDHIFRPDRFIEYLDALPRLVALMVKTADWESLIELHTCIEHSVKVLRDAKRLDQEDGIRADREIKVNGFEVRGGRAKRLNWSALERTISESIAESILRSLTPLTVTDMQRIPASVMQLAKRGTKRPFKSDIQSLWEEVDRLWESDLAVVAYKDHLRTHVLLDVDLDDKAPSLLRAYEYEADLRRFFTIVAATAQQRPGHRKSPSDASVKPSVLPFLFPTRPMRPRDISRVLGLGELVSGKSEHGGFKDFAAFVRAVSGYSLPDGIDDPVHALKATKPDRAGRDQREPAYPPIAKLDYESDQGPIRLGIPSLRTEESSWLRSASGSSDLSIERYRRIESIVNQAIKAQPRPTYLLLPELSLPEQWVRIISERLLAAKINLIAGLDYEHTSGADSHGAPVELIHSNALLVLRDTRFGFDTAIEIRQPKAQAAPHEERYLLREHGKQWHPGVAHNANGRKRTTGVRQWVGTETA